MFQVYIIECSSVYAAGSSDIMNVKKILLHVNCVK